MKTSRVKQIASYKKVKGVSQLPPPWINFYEAQNAEFLQYVPLVPTLKATGEVIKCDHRNIDARLDSDRDNRQLKDIALFGRSNVGKSSLVNAITGLTLAQTSKNPGKTRDLSMIDLGENRRVIDCPGYGFARASQTEKEQWRRLMDTYLRTSTSLHRVMLLIDLTTGLMDNDKLLADVLCERTKTVTLVFTKVDKVKPAAVLDKAQSAVKELQT
jgi:ribosome biogenesis GTP-binding protein YsxC/EngB